MIASYSDELELCNVKAKGKKPNNERLQRNGLTTNGGKSGKRGGACEKLERCERPCKFL